MLGMAPDFDTHLEAAAAAASTHSLSTATLLMNSAHDSSIRLAELDIVK